MDFHSALALETIENTTLISHATLLLDTLVHAVLFLEIVDVHFFNPKSVSGATSLPASPTMTGVCLLIEKEKRETLKKQK